MKITQLATENLCETLLKDFGLENIESLKLNKDMRDLLNRTLRLSSSPFGNDTAISTTHNIQVIISQLELILACLGYKLVVLAAKD